jgi:YfiH family protein
MEKKFVNDLPLWHFNNLASISTVQHFVTTRHGDVPDTFTMSLTSTPDRSLVVRNRARLAAALGVDASQLYFPSQIHETTIVEVHPAISMDQLQGVDALITAHKHIAIAVMSADCVPVLLYDKKRHVSAAIHAGWRGTVKQIVAKTLVALHDRYGTEGKDVVAGIGPSASPDVYEVGNEVIEAVKTHLPNCDTLLTLTQPGKAKFDLWQANKNQLLSFGVLASNIEVSEKCTLLDNGQFYSARKGDTGRFSAGIILR